MADALRLTFQYRNGEFVALEPQRVRMIVPQLYPPHDGPLPEGRYAELRSADGKVLTMVPLAEALRTVEYPTGNPEQPFGRVELPEGMIVSALVVADERATEAALVEIVTSKARGPAESAKRDLAIVSLARGAGQ